MTVFSSRAQSTTLGVAGAVTPLAPGAYNGQYSVVGDLYLANGLYLIDGADFGITGIARRIFSGTFTTGNKLIIGPNADVRITNSTFEAQNFKAWYGFYFEPNQPGQRFTMADSYVKTAAYPIHLPPSTQSSYYNVYNTTFDQCLYGLYDTGRHHLSELSSSTYPSRFTGNTIRSTLGYLYYPYQGTAGQPATQYTTYEAVHLAVDGDATFGNAVDVEVNYNVVDGAVYGIVANQATGFYLVLGGLMSGIRRRGLWLDQDATRTFNVTQSISLVGTPTATAQTTATDKVYGIYATERTVDQGTAGIDVYGDHGDDPANYKEQTGLYYETCNGELRLVNAQHLTYGLSVGNGSSANFFNNSFLDCWRGLQVRDNSTSSPDYYLGCNSFTNSTGAPGYQAIAVAASAVVNGNNTLAYRVPPPGTLSIQPAGNRFLGYSVGVAPYVYNDNNSAPNMLSYQKFANSTDESITAIEGLGGGNVPFGTLTINSSNNCAARGYGGNGAMQRGAAPAGGAR
ncbi:hypothetical protein, partial [Hymenobacter agri]